MVLFDVKKPSSIADKSRDNSRGQKSRKEGKKGAVQWENFLYQRTTLYARLNVISTLFYNCTISRVSFACFSFFLLELRIE